MRAVRPVLYLVILLTLLFLAVSPPQTTRQGTPRAAVIPATPGPTSMTDASRQLPQGLPALESGDPAHLLIPAIQLSASVEVVGVMQSGDLATPARNPWTSVGWYAGGPRPGERGSAVIDGHLDRPGHVPAVFWRLSDLRPGALVLVNERGGHQLHFRVTRLAFYPPAQAPVEAIFGDTSGTYLNLITCAGDWIPSQHQTTLRLVVYTTLVP